MKPKVSIIVAVYNLEALIDRCLQSLINQSLKDIEIILVNDCSTDDSLKVCQNAAKIDSRIKIVNKSVNQGLGMTRNSGIDVAEGEFLSFVDGDDYVELDLYEKAYNLAKQNNSDEVIYGYYNELNNGDLIGHEVVSIKRTYEKDEVMQLLFPEIIGTLPNEKSDYSVGFAPWANIVRTEVIKANNLKFVSERELIYEDLMFALDKYQYINSVSILEGCYYHYCVNPVSLTQTIRIDRYDRLKEMYSYLKQNAAYKKLLFCNEDVNIRFCRTMLSYIRLCIMQLSTNKKYIGKIKTITKDEMCREIMAKYPTQKLPLKQAVFAFLLKYRAYRLLYLITRMHLK